MSYLTSFLFALIGLFIQSFVKITGINDRTPKDVSIGTIIKNYVREDFAKIGISILCIFLEIEALKVIESVDKLVLFTFDFTEYKYVIVKGQNLMLPFVSFFSCTLVFLGKSKTEKFLKAKSE